MRNRVVIGSRGSDLALVQARSVLNKLRGSHSDIDFELVKITTGGDRDRTVPLYQMAGDGVFVKELEEALMDRRIDIAVHSLKDMPTQIPGELSLAAVGERIDPRDVLITGGSKLNELPAGARIGTGSLRRIAQISNFYPELKAEAVRGNIDTRINKVLSGDFNGVVLAAAAIIRMGWEEKITEFLSPEQFLPAVGQGALGLEIRSDDREVEELVSGINHRPTWCSIVAERAFLLALGGGCRAPIAALGTVSGDVLKLEGMVSDAAGKSMMRDSEEGNASESEQVGIRLAQRMLQEGASQILAEVKA